MLEAVDIGFAAGEVSALVGPNGSGKTTLLRHLAGLDVAGRRPGRARRPRRSPALGAALRARRIAYLPQGASAYWPLLGATSWRWVACRMAPISAGRWRAAGRRAVQRALLRVDGDGFAGAPSTCPVARRARAADAGAALATEADIVLADEPVASLDPAYALDAMAILRAEARRGACVVVSLHDLGLAARFADRVIVLAEEGSRPMGRRARPCGPT